MAQGAAASSKRKASDGDDAVAPSPKAKAKPSAKAKAAAEKMVFTEANRPPVPAPKAGTTWYRKGKIHRNSGAFRVFLSAGDRCDKKVKIKDEDNCEAEWQRALSSGNLRHMPSSQKILQFLCSVNSAVAICAMHR